MKRYKISTIDGEIEFKLISSEDADSYYHTLLRDDSRDLEEYIFNSITEYKYSDKVLCAGTVPTVVYAAIKLSGLVIGKFGFIDAIEEERKRQEENAYYPLYKRIVEMMPTYKLEDIKNKTFNEMIELLIFAEGMYGKHFVDTKKAREQIIRKDEENNGIAPVKKGIKGLTKADLDAIKNAINYNDTSNML